MDRRQWRKQEGIYIANKEIHSEASEVSLEVRKYEQNKCMQIHTRDLQKYPI